MRARIVIFATAAFALTGCSSSYQFEHEGMQQNAKLNPELGVLISTPDDGFYGQKKYPNSAKATVQTIKSEFLKYSKNVDITQDCKGKQCLQSIDNQQYGYYIEPVILHWEDRNTEWSGKSDKVEIQIITYDAKTHQIIKDARFSGKSKWMTLGGDHPQDLLKDPTEEYINSLYQ
ncbi:DUF4823 domain-containing protein [Shewanella gaetbuli]|uniref:DUF4823 domain-containing protein n=1 Tax=Shewanella gaetbuli TaxID=220752 RepID=A0A9X1ZLW4_9GAMM|nr:DUF4823 domain-containing protein [Shewanella gaetbuli]MCL1143966.1 DUF4823 domain-containing protein [Shewanella gaetbuli]